MTSETSSISHLCTASLLMSTAEASWSKDFMMGVCSAGSECHMPHTVLTLRRNRPFDAWYVVRNWTYLQSEHKQISDMWWGVRHVDLSKECVSRVAEDSTVFPYLLLWAGRGVAAVLVTSKKKAMVVPGSTPPRNQEFVPL